MGAAWQQASKTAVEFAVTERAQFAELEEGPGDIAYSAHSEVLTQPEEMFMMAVEWSLKD